MSLQIGVVRRRAQRMVKGPAFASAAAAAAAMLLVLSSGAASGELIPVWGGPTYDPTTGTGLVGGYVPNQQYGVNASGTAVGGAAKYAGNTYLGTRAARWDLSGGGAIELGHSGTNTSGVTHSVATGVDAAGNVVGYSIKYVDGRDRGRRAVRWNAGATVAIELETLDTSLSGGSDVYGLAVNAAGTAVGRARKHIGERSIGYRAVRWDAGGAAVTELDHLGTNDAGVSNGSASVISANGTAGGFVHKYNASISLGERGVRWDAGGTAATELGHLGTNTSGFTRAFVYAINRNGTAFGTARKYDQDTNLGDRAVRWDAGSTIAIELGHLGANPSGIANARVYAANDSGTAVGSSESFSGSTYLGGRPVRWDAGSTTATELGTFGTFGGATDATAFAVNSDGTAVGTVADFVGGALLGYRAVLWGADAVAIDLNALIDPTSGWTLTEARSISDTNFVAGVGLFDPDGPGPLQAYGRAFVLDATAAIPEPAAPTMLSLAALALLRRRARPA